MTVREALKEIKRLDALKDAAVGRQDFDAAMALREKMDALRNSELKEPPAAPQ